MQAVYPPEISAAQYDEARKIFFGGVVTMLTYFLGSAAQANASGGEKSLLVCIDQVQIEVGEYARGLVMKV